VLFIGGMSVPVQSGRGFLLIEVVSAKAGVALSEKSYYGRLWTNLFHVVNDDGVFHCRL